MRQNRPQWRCEVCARLSSELFYCASCWRMACPNCYDPCVSLCSHCAQQLFNGKRLQHQEGTDIRTRKKQPVARFPSRKDTELRFPEVTDAVNLERTKDLELARITGYCPKCADKTPLVMLVDGSYCPKCGRIFMRHPDTLRMPLTGMGLGESNASHQYEAYYESRIRRGLEP